MENEYKVFGHEPPFDSATPIFEKHYFFKNGPKNVTKVENLNFFFCILGINFIGLFDDILHVLIFLLVVDKQRDFDWGWILICYRL